MARLFKNRKLERNPKFCRFCANHGINVHEKGHRSECKLRYCTCEKCTKNAKKVQTSKDHRKKKANPQNNQLGNPSTSRETAANETAMTLRSFIASNLDDFFQDLSQDASNDTINKHEDPSAFIQSLPMFYVDDNMNEIENFGSNQTPLPQPEATTVEYLETSIDAMVESLVTEYGTEIPLLYRALLNVCGGDYAEAARRIEEAKNEIPKK